MPSGTQRDKRFAPVIVRRQAPPRFGEACDIVIKEQKGSASLLQRKMGIGYAEAARHLDVMENWGIVGPTTGIKPRAVLIADNGKSYR